MQLPPAVLRRHERDYTGTATALESVTREGPRKYQLDVSCPGCHGGHDVVESLEGGRELGVEPTERMVLSWDTKVTCRQHLSEGRRQGVQKC